MWKPRTGRAVVIGASMAGLLAAWALHESFEEVWVLDRDALPGSPQVRKGVPQGGHTHGLLARGRDALDQMFPGLSDDLIAAGVPVADVQNDLQWWVDGRPLAQAPSGMLALTPSRPLLEDAVRRRVTALPNVDVLPLHQATGLTLSADGWVNGVDVIRADRLERITGVDLVLDASGRSARSRLWLEQLGLGPVEEQRIETRMTYVTRRYRRLPQHLDGRVGTSIGSYPGKSRSAFVLAQENDTWVVTITGRFGEVPPTDEKGMLAWVADLDSPDAPTIIQEAEPIGEPLKMRSPASVRLRYDRMTGLPPGLLVAGDALCSFNPAYGQGMTVAALEALALARLLKEGVEDLFGEFFAESADLIAVPWSVVASSDLRFAETVGDRSALDGRNEAYLERLRKKAAHDPLLANAFLRVAQLMDSPRVLFGPDIVSRVETGD